MATYYSPKIVTDGLVFCLDAASRNGISALGCGGFNGAPQLVKNMVSPSDVISDFGGVRLGNLTYYTAFAIDYPEGNYGGDAAGRHGITPGFNVRTGTKTYDASRALHLYAWNNAISAWIEGEFNGARLSGHCYDNYTGAETGYAAELAKFVTDYNNIKTKYPDVSFVVIGSHRADRYSQAVRDILTDLGKPAGYIDSDYIAAPEWILIGKPGLGAGNYYGWAYENYTTNPSQVAHLNFGLPLFGSKNNYFLFDGVDDYINLGTNLPATFSSSQAVSIFTYAKISSVVSKNTLITFNGERSFFLPGNRLTTTYQLYWDSVAGWKNGTNSSWTVDQWYYLGWTISGTTLTFYVNGVANGTATVSAFTPTASTPVRIGFANAGEYAAGSIASVSVYNKALTATEILQNYNAVKGRFGL